MDESSTVPEWNPAAWQERAKADLDAAETLAQAADGRRRFPAHIGFLAQQAIEKWLKAIMAATDREPPRTHDIDFLIGRCEGELPTIFERRDEFSWLTAFAARARYPGEDQVEPDMAKRALSQAEEVGELVEQWFEDQEKS